MRIIHSLWLLGSLCGFPQLAKSQVIGVGDRMPDVYLANIYRHTKPSGNFLKEFGGKPIIIDFWFTACTICIREMPKMDSLQKQYAGKLSIVLATYQPIAEASAFLTTNHLVRNVSLPSVTSDSVLKRLFPHMTAPHEVWIDRYGVVQAITGHEAVTRENVQAFVEGKPLNLPIKQEIMDNNVWWGYLPFVSVDRTYNGGRGVDIYTYIGKYSAEMKGSKWPFILDTATGILRTRCINNTLKHLYQLAYQQQMTSNFSELNTFVEDFKDKAKHSHLIKIEDRVFCYDQMIRDTSTARGRRILLEDLNRYFQLTSRIEKKAIDCYVIRRTSAQNKLAFQGVKKGYYDEQGFLVLSGAKWWAVVENSFNNTMQLPYKVIDETNFPPNDLVEFKVWKDWTDLAALNKGLAAYDLKVSVEKREQNVITLRDAEEQP